MKRKKKLPKFALGTRMPRSLGYQPNYGIGNTQFTSTPGESLVPETKTVRQNIIPNALNKLTSTSQFALDGLKSMFPSTVGATASINNAAINAAAAGGVGARLSQPGAGADYMGSMFPGSVSTNTTTNAGTQAASKSINALGGVLGGIGTVYGLADMGMQLAHNKDHRTAGDMRNYMTTNTYTTDLGNQYKLTTGLDRGAELDYADAQKLSKNVNFTTSAIGTGLSLGTMLAALGAGGSVLGPIGAGAGLLGGLAAYALGFGDTKEDVKQAMKDIEDSTAREGRMSESLAKSADAKQGFYSNSAGAANGKLPAYRNGKPNARVSNGEVIGSFKNGWVERVPGKPNNNDTNERYLPRDAFVITNKYGLSDYAAATGDYMGALYAQDMLMRNKGNGYKCGKLPKYYDGTPLQAVLAAIPHLGALTSIWGEHNRLKNASTYTPTEEINDNGVSDIASRMMANKLSARPQLNMANKLLFQNAYNVRNNVGAGPGGRMIQYSDLFNKALGFKGGIITDTDKYNIGLTNEALQLQAKNKMDTRQLQHDAWWRSNADRNQKIGSLNNLLSSIGPNLYTVGSSLANNLSGILQAGEANKIQKELAAIYGAKTKSEQELELQKFNNLVEWQKFLRNNPQMLGQVSTTGVGQ